MPQTSLAFQGWAPLDLSQSILLLAVPFPREKKKKKSKGEKESNSDSPKKVLEMLVCCSSKEISQLLFFWIASVLLHLAVEI